MIEARLMLKTKLEAPSPSLTSLKANSRNRQTKVSEWISMILPEASGMSHFPKEVRPGEGDVSFLV